MTNSIEDAQVHMLSLGGLGSRHHRVINRITACTPGIALSIKPLEFTGLPVLCQMPLPNLPPSMLWIWAKAQLAELML
jgi:hypothetical protein